MSDRRTHQINVVLVVIGAVGLPIMAIQAYAGVMAVDLERQGFAAQVVTYAWSAGAVVALLFLVYGLMRARALTRLCGALRQAFTAVRRWARIQADRLRIQRDLGNRGLSVPWAELHEPALGDVRLGESIGEDGKHWRELSKWLWVSPRACGSIEIALAFVRQPAEHDVCAGLAFERYDDRLLDVSLSSDGSVWYWCKGEAGGEAVPGVTITPERWTLLQLRLRPRLISLFVDRKLVKQIEVGSSPRPEWPDRVAARVRVGGLAGSTLAAVFSHPVVH